MVRIQKAAERGETRTGWLDSRHSFSFNQWYDEQWVHFGPLRVLNEDFVRAGAGFPTHPHREMEILTYVVEGALEHRDSTGSHGVIRTGELQRMSAGRGITHSEHNHSQEEDLHFLQIWIIPERSGIDPGYEQKEFTRDARRNVLLPVAMRKPEGGALTLHQDAVMFISHLEKGKGLRHALQPGRGAYAFLITGGIRIADNELAPGDAAMVTDETAVELRAVDESELVFFDLRIEDWDMEESD
jgi:redox-sensitive bicupin YhaK (pirin superfamily)